MAAGDTTTLLPMQSDLGSIPKQRVSETSAGRQFAGRVTMVALLALGGIFLYSLAVLKLTDGSTLDVGKVNTKITFGGDGWVFTLTWFGGLLATIAAITFPFSERFAQSLAVSFGSLMALAFPIYVWRRQTAINEDAKSVGAGVILASICFALAALAPWVNILVLNRVEPVLGRDWSKWLFLLPAVAWILLLTVFPLAYAITTSRYVFRNGKISRFVGWDNYRRLFQRDLVAQPVWDALVVAVVFAVLIVGIGLVWKFVANRRVDAEDARGLVSLLPIFLVPSFLIVMLAGMHNLWVAFGAPQFVVSFLDWFGQGKLVSQSHLGLLRDPVDNGLSVTVVFVVIAVGMEMVFGFSLALLMNRELRGRSALRAILTLPIFAAPVGIGYLGRTIFYESGGPVNQLFDALGITPKPWLSDPFWSKVTTVIADIWQWTPFVFVIALAGLQSLPQEVIEASEVDGANWWQSFRGITLPMVSPILWLILLLRTIDAFKVFDIAQSMTVGGPGRATEYYSMLNYRTARKFFNYGDAAAQAFLLLLIVSILITVLWSKISHVYEDEEARA